MQQKTRLKQGLWWLLAILVCSAPLLLSSFLMRTRANATLAELVPIWVDEVHYWHQAASFRAVGFANGYYTYDERPARAPFTRYYAWGFGAPALYGISSVLPGWSLAAMPAYNLAFLTLGLAICILLGRPGFFGLLLLGASVLLFAPFLIYYFTSLLPVLELGIALGLAGGLLRWARQPSQFGLLLLLAALALASLIRVTWALLAFPLLLSATMLRPRPRGLLFALLSALFFNLAAWGFYAYTAAPFPNLPNRVLSLLPQAPTEAFTLWRDHTLLNLRSLTQGNIVEVQQRALALLVWISSLLALSAAMWRWRRNSANTDEKARLQSIIRSIGSAAFQLAVLALMAIFVYDAFEWRDLRLMAPALLLALALLALLRHWALLLPALAFMALMLPETMKVHDIWLDFHLSPERSNAFYAWREALVDVAAYDPQAASPWCNTVSHSVYYLFNDVFVLLALDPGLGLSSSHFDPPTLPFRARWLLLDDAFYAQYEPLLRVEPLRQVPAGWLYRNLDSPCQ